MAAQFSWPSARGTQWPLTKTVATDSLSATHSAVSLSSTTQRPPDGQPKRWAPGIIIPVVVALGVGLLVLSAVNIASGTSANLRMAPRLTAPGTIRVHLTSGSYSLCENVEEASYPLNPASVTVMVPGGPVHTVSARSDLSGIGSPFDTTVYGSVVAFTAPLNGTYVITARSGQSTMLLGKSFSSLVHELAGCVAGGIAGLLAIVVGVILLILRRSGVKSGGPRARGGAAETPVPGVGL